MLEITAKALVEDLYYQTGAMPVSLVARTKPDLIGGKSSPLVGLEKVAYASGLINWKYSNAVNNQREREGQPVDAAGNVEEFVAQARKWGERVHDELILTRAGKPRLLPWVRKKKGATDRVTLEELLALPTDELYLEFKSQRSIEYKYYLNGSEVDADLAHKYIRPKSESKRQQVDNEIILRDYRLDHIEKITYNGQTFLIAG